MPIPTLATCIILTSLPPSPIANVIPPSYYFTNFTINAFYFGELRQNIIDDAERNIYMFFFDLLLRINVIAMPYIMILI
jgi:hypothetical protein